MRISEYKKDTLKRVVMIINLLAYKNCFKFGNYLNKTEDYRIA
jgi:hypothetical protein